jgi:GT2 family glycosyltransferase
MPSSTPCVSIFIPTYNDQADLMVCLDSISCLDYPKNRMEIFLWDNASLDDTLSLVRERFNEMENEGWLSLQLVPWKRNEGSYIPYNLAMSRLNTKSRFIFGLDADVALEPDSLHRLVDAATSEKVAAVGARSVYFDSPNETSHGAGFVSRWTGRYKVVDLSKQFDCDYVIGCCWLLRKETFAELKGFDPDYYINHWEVDYCLRAKRKGYRVVYEPKAVARHKIEPGGPLSEERIYYLYRNKLLLIEKSFSWTHKFTAFCVFLLVSVPWGLLILCFRRNHGRRKASVVLSATLDGLLGRTGKRSSCEMHSIPVK